MKVSKDEYWRMKLFILRKLLVHGVIGAKHTSIENLAKSLPKHLRGGAKEVIDDLVREAFLLSHPTSYGLQVSLNPNKLQEIKKLLDVDGT